MIKKNRVISNTFIVILVTLFVVIMSWTVEFRYFTLNDIRLLAILLSCTGILVLIGHSDFEDIVGLREGIRFNLFLTAMVMTVLLSFNIVTEPTKSELFRILFINAFKPFILGIIAYLPIINVMSRLEKNISIKRKHSEKSLSHEEIKYPDLTRREREVFDLALQDYCNKEVAEQLFIAETTVKKHMQNILRKIECGNREELIEKYSGLLLKNKTLKQERSQDDT